MSVTIWTTVGCNLKCKYCYELINNQRNNEINVTNIEEKSILNWIIQNQLGKELIIFHGGEPLLNFSLLKKITNYLNDVNKMPERMGLTTNGMVWNNDIEQFFMQYKDVFEKDISISIDGIESEHNKNRRTFYDEGSYRKVIETQKKMINIFPDLKARITLTPNSICSFYDGVRSLLDLDFKIITASLDEYNKQWTEKNIETLKIQIYKIIDLWDKDKNLRLPFIDSILYRKRKEKCNFSYNVYPNGEIYPCVAVAGLKNFCIGNVIDGLNKDKIERLNEKLNIEYDLCQNCNNINYCVHNRCKLVNYALNNDYSIPNMLGCRFESLKFEIEKYLSKHIKEYGS